MTLRPKDKSIADFHEIHYNIRRWLKYFGCVGKILMIAAVIMLAILITLILLLLAVRQSREDANIRKTRPSPSLPAPPAEKKPAALLPPALHQNPPAPPHDDALSRPDVHADLRQFLRKGFDQIFNAETDGHPVGPKPLTRRDIEPRIFEDVLGHIAGLNRFRTQHVQLQKMVNDPSVQMTDLSKIILSDPIITAKILRMANSPYFGLQQKIDSISHALMLLGIQNLKNILYREGMRELFQAESARHQEAVAALWKHSSLTSVCAQHLYGLFSGLNRGTLFTLGIIHDIGKLIILDLPQAKQLTPEFWKRYPASVSLTEEDQLLGVNHAVIGGLAMEHWTFSDLMTDVVSAHHFPSHAAPESPELGDETMKYILVLFLADQLARLFADWNEGMIQTYRLHPSYAALIDQNQLINKILDANFLAQIRETERLAMDEKEGKGGSGPERRERTPRIFSAPAANPVPSSTRVIGRYEVVSEIGHGMTGIVYLARDPLINREIAVKTLRYQNVDEREIAEARSRFFTEARMIGRLSHPNIVTIHDIGDFRGGTYIAMEFLDGTDLVPFCDPQNRLSLPEIIQIISSAALALDYAHRTGVIHRDIKPGNIRLLQNGTVKVIDFGIAGISEMSGTKNGWLLGSPNYMSPEQIAGAPLDGRSDLYSLGVVFYELLTGRKPFPADDLTDLFEQIKTKDPIAIRTLSQEVPDELIALVEKCLAKEKEQRFASGQDLADALAAGLQKTAFHNPPKRSAVPRR